MFKTTANHLSLATLSILSFGNLFADNATDQKQMQNIENRLTALEQRKGSNGTINPEGRFIAEDGAHLFINGEALLLKVEEDGLSYAVLGASSPPKSNSADVLQDFQNPRGKARSQNLDWNWGFRVGAGYNLCHDGWDVSLNWLRVANSSSNTSNAHPEGNNYVIDIRLPNSLIHNNDTLDVYASFNSIDSHWKFALNQLDLDMGRMFYVSKFLKLRPHTGIRSDWINQDFTLFYKNTYTHNRGFRQKEKNHFFGVGLVGGLDTLWGLGNGWSIYANGAISLLYGKFNVNDNSVETTSADTAINNRLYMEQTSKGTRAITDLTLGLRWDRNFADDSFHLGLNAGWEQHIYFNQNQIFMWSNSDQTGTVTNASGDLTVQGFALGLRMDF